MLGTKTTDLQSYLPNKTRCFKGPCDIALTQRRIEGPASLNSPAASIYLPQ